MASLTTRLIPGKKRAPQLLADSAPVRCALSRLGQAMLSPATAPRLEFRQALRGELVAQAAIQARVLRPPRRPPKVRKPSGGFRLAALGIGLSAAGGGFALAANRTTPPELPTAPAPHSAAAGLHQAAPVTAPAAALTGEARRGTGPSVATSPHSGGSPSPHPAMTTTEAPPKPSAGLAGASLPAVPASAPTATVTAAAHSLSASLTPEVAAQTPAFSLGSSPPANPLRPLKKRVVAPGTSWPPLFGRQLP
jgi:hypothetical protein